ncbi:mitogen-activated protein kinase kinase kinase 10-like [Amphiura filiformis]|uniref:mitogen-activated protein kinase kinase kinase 10-like n=1 Tax=Amphiura filiformis TaxID=82378 RepID=UPI003B20BAF8
MGASLTYHEFLGSGSSGTVYRVTWKSKEFGTIEAAAKKMIKFDKETTKQHKHEIEFLKKLDHKNIIRYYDTVIEKEHVVIITEFAAKGSLYDYLKDKDGLPEKHLHHWIYDLACGVNYLKKNNVALHNLKSPNCMLTADDVLKICDFGVAKDLTSTRTEESTKENVRWQAPDNFTDQVVSPKAAIYAFGIIVWEMVSCEEPYSGFTSEKVIHEIMANDLHPTIPDDCPQFLRELIEKCWHQDPMQRAESSEIVRRVWCKYRPTPTCTDEILTEADGLEWKFKHEVNHSGGELRFLASDHLATCTLLSVNVHRVSREESHLLYTLKSDEWTGDVWPCGVAMSESMPDSVLVLGYRNPYVYQFPNHEATNYVKKYQIHDGNVKPLCIAANANTAVIGLHLTDALVVCSLPGFTQQRIVDLSFNPWDLTISTDYLVIMGYHEMVIKPMGDMGQDLCRIQPPDGCDFRAVSYRNDAQQLYAACYHKGNGKGHVCKYIWDPNGTPMYNNTGCVIDDVEEVCNGGLSVASDGVLAVSAFFSPGSKIFSLE